MKKHYDNSLLSDIKDYIQADVLDVAEAKIEDYKILYPDDLIINKYYAQLLIKRNKYVDAENVCLDVLDSYFHDKRLKSDMYLTLADALVNQNKISDAIHALETAYSLKDCNTQSIQVRLASLYMKANEKDKAMQVLNKTENNALNKSIELQRAIIYFNENQFDLALNILLDISDDDLKNKKDVQRKNLYIGNIYKIKDDYTNAIFYYTKVLLNKNDYYWYAYCEIGHIKYKEGYVDEAINILESTIKRYPANRVYENLIKCYIFKGEFDKCYRIINKITDKDIKTTYLGRLELTKKNYDVSENILSESINNFSNCNYSYMNQANYYLLLAKYRQKKYEEVLEDLTNLTSLKYFDKKYKRELLLLKFYLNYVLGNNPIPNTYSERQIVSYSEQRAIEHIQYHHKKASTISQFDDSVNIYNLFYFVRSRIDFDQKLVHEFLDKYTLDFPKNMGSDNTRNLRSVSAVCLPDTKNILTMYPYRYEQIVDDNQDELYNNNKIKRLSQIEKFNKKYNI